MIITDSCRFTAINHSENEDFIMERAQTVKRDVIFIAIVSIPVGLHLFYFVPLIILRLNVWWRQEFSRSVPGFLQVIVAIGSTMILGMLLSLVSGPFKNWLSKILED